MTWHNNKTITRCKGQLFPANSSFYFQQNIEFGCRFYKNMCVLYLAYNKFTLNSFFYFDLFYK